ncbi:MAG TPA: hypothetical protein VJN71_02780, partial [Nitrososphaerales archaeon]|nr:hypothetical protein [Nitrososphaerales archaeon]
ELFEGAYNSRNIEGESKKVRDLLKRVELLEFSAQSCEKYGKLANDLKISRETDWRPRHSYCEYRNVP